jgi:hypothetical protein
MFTRSAARKVQPQVLPQNVQQLTLVIHAAAMEMEQTATNPTPTDTQTTATSATAVVSVDSNAAFADVFAAAEAHKQLYERLAHQYVALSLANQNMELANVQQIQYHQALSTQYASLLLYCQAYEPAIAAMERELRNRETHTQNLRQAVENEHHKMTVLAHQLQQFQHESRTVESSMCAIAAVSSNTGAPIATMTGVSTDAGVSIEQHATNTYSEVKS